MRYFTCEYFFYKKLTSLSPLSSEREPSQVFRLLETVYRAFDLEGSKAGVFKVETVGDSYVAVTGLPDPREDHAVLIAKYAIKCLLKFNVLAKRLEPTLGPGTASLGMRFGLHSGPVTAGVLRGEKSRFQLFGDTINVVSTFVCSCIGMKFFANDIDESSSHEM
jgi:class 3 adenylate cyclase